MTRHTISDVSDTALWVAVYRAMETERPDGLFRDPLAGLLAGERGKGIAAGMQGTRYTSWTVVIRTCIIDSYIRELISGGADTIINLGAGLDTRPYRLELPGSLRWIEVDYPHIIKLKEERLAQETPRCKLERVSLDLSDQEKRNEFFARVGAESRKVVILTEGVTPYLSNEQVGQLSRDLRRQQSFRFWIIDYYSPQVLKYMQSAKRTKQMRNAPIRFFPGDWFAFFGETGWAIREKRYIADESEKLGRAVPMPWWFRIVRVFISRRKKRDFGKFSGYFLLEPK